MAQKTKPPKTKTKQREAVDNKARPEFWLYAIALLAGLFAAFQVYAPALHGPFLFDDTYLPMNVPSWMNSPLSNWISGVRPLLMLSYWTNYQSAGSDTAQYHAWNVFFHFLNVTLVYFVVRKLLQFAAAPPIFALFAAGLFLLHPLQTEAVSYIAGRSDSLSTVFFLAAFALFLYRRSQAITWPVAAGILVLFGAAMLTKENTVVLPALLLLTDYFWNPGFSFEGIRRNWRLYAPMAVGGVIGLIGVFRILGGADSAGFQTKFFTWYEYLFTQFRVFFTYLRLFIFPIGQTVDYDIPVSHSLLDHGAIFGLVGILVLIGAAVYFHRRYPLAAYGFLIFAIILAPTSSIIPIKDPISERRIYLPMIGLLLIAIDAIRRLKIGRQALAASLGAVLLLAGIATYQRNIVWSGAVPLWEDAVKKSPRKARAHFQLAYAYYTENRCQEADQGYQKVAELEKPDYRLLLDWALADNCLNRHEAALQKFQQAAALEKTAHVYTQIAMMHAKMGKTEEAFQALATAQALDPSFDVTYLYRGQLLAGMNNLPAAEQEYRRALAANPNNQQAIELLQQVQTHLRMRR
jgi:tetratricopeptide (TPR) repeat protein